MVGVAGRSQACHTCRQRRKACSGERPCCSQCVNAKRECAGYERQAVFIEVREPFDTGSRKTQKALASSRSGLQIAVPDRKPRGRPAKFVADSQHIGDITADLLSPAKLFHQQFLSQLIESWTPGNLSGLNDIVSWLHFLPDHPTSSNALEKSTQALSLARIGRTNKDEYLIKQGMVHYGEGLKRLQVALQDPKQAGGDETLGACMALVAYELMECPGGTDVGWIAHQDGLARLIRLRGPDAHIDGLGHQIFLVFRIQGILLAAHQKTSTFLAEPGWKDVPMKNDKEGTFDKLLKIFVDAPDVLRKANHLSNLEGLALANAFFDILDCLWDIDGRLQTFYSELEKQTAGSLYTPRFATRIPNTGICDEQQPQLFPVAFYFANLRIASTMLWYWALCTMVWPGMVACSAALAKLLENHHVGIAGCPQEQDLTPLWNRLKAYPPLDHRTDCLSMAWNICQSVEYCMQGSMLGAGPAALTGVLNVVYNTLKSFQPLRERELQWVVRARQGVSERALRFLSYVDH